MYVFIQSSDQDSIGTVNKQYVNFDKIEKEKIGSGGFGKVYRCGRTAVKEEYKVCMYVFIVLYTDTYGIQLVMIITSQLVLFLETSHHCRW